MNMRFLWIIPCILALFFIFGQSPVVAADYPSKPIRIIYPFPAGSGGDIAARILADAVGKELGKPVKVSNVTGGRGTIGARQVVQAKKDGYEIGALPIGPSVTQPIFSEKLPYKTEDLVPICQYTYLPIVLVAGAHTPYKTTKEFIAYAKEHPGQVKYAHPGVGTVPYLMLKALETATGIQMKGIPYKGLAPGVTAVVGGHIDIALAVLGAVLGHQKAGKLSVMGVFSGERMDLAPNIPTVEEDGITTYPQVWSGVFAPKGVDAAVIAKLEDAFSKAIQSKRFLEAMQKAKNPVLYLGRTAFQDKINADIKYFKDYKAKSKK